MYTNPENTIVVSIELAKKMEKVGFPQDTYLAYYNHIKNDKVEVMISNYKNPKIIQIAAAPTADEIVNELTKNSCWMKVETYQDWISVVSWANCRVQRKTLAEAYGEIYCSIKTGLYIK